jgi:hypothetical protein
VRARVAYSAARLTMARPPATPIRGCFTLLF